MNDRVCQEGLRSVSAPLRYTQSRSPRSQSLLRLPRWGVPHRQARLYYVGGGSVGTPASNATERRL